MIRTSAAKKSVRLASLELEQRFELCSHIVNHTGWGFAYKSRAALLPRGTAQLVGLHDTPYLVTIRYRNTKAPIAVATCYRARMQRPVSSLKARGESTSAGRRPACSLPTGCKKSSQMISPELGQ